jgi:hypothetical protein
MQQATAFRVIPRQSAALLLCTLRSKTKHAKFASLKEMYFTNKSEYLLQLYNDFYEDHPLDISVNGITMAPISTMSRDM